MKGASSWRGNAVYDNYLNGLNPQDNSDDMTIVDNHVSEAGNRVLTRALSIPNG